jgi:alpha-tubulin suppressor-like RCC1 family protein
MTRPLSPTRSGGRVRCLMGRLAPVLTPTVVAFALGCGGDTQSPTAPEPTLALATAQVLSFLQVSAGDIHTCGVTTDNRAYCWGQNTHGQLGDGSPLYTRRLKPVAVAGGLRFLEINAGVGHTCGVTTDYRAYCWGHNDRGQLGDGTTTDRPRPVVVGGGRRFRQVSAGAHHSCGVNPYDVAFCWGTGYYGQLGIGAGYFSTLPVRVSGGLLWRRVNAGFSHTCGATTSDRGYCWGKPTGARKPVAVAGGLSFRNVLAGSGYISDAGDPNPDYILTCGVTTAQRAYCWGVGAIGSGGNSSGTPAAVDGGRLRSVSPGAFHACGVNPYDVAFCWGENTDGQLGIGAINYATTPVRVAGGLRFHQVSASGIGRHTCGETTDHRAYCWGRNNEGQLGDGTTVSRLKPVAVAAVP